MEIKHKYPELSKYLEELLVTIPKDSGSQIYTHNLKNYCETPFKIEFLY